MRVNILLAALMPFSVFAQNLTNPTNNPGLPGYQNPTQQRMQLQMQTQQAQQKGMLNQQLQTRTQIQQQHLQSQIDNNTQRTRQGELNPRTQQLLPNTQGGMLNQTTESSGQQHMLQQNADKGKLAP